MIGRTWMQLGGALLLTSLPSVARAQEAPTVPTSGGVAATNGLAATSHATSSEWGGFYDGRTLGSGGGAVIAEAGWPGFTGGALFGMGSSFDLGVKLSPLYAGMYVPRIFQANFGLDLRAVTRFGIVRGDTVSFLLRFEPGVRFATVDPVEWGPELVVGADVGIRVMPGGSIYLGLEVPLYFNVPDNTGINTFFVAIPLLGGVGFEYHANDFIGFGARFNAGPDIVAGDLPGSPDVEFAFLAQAFFVLRWDRAK